MRLIQYLQGLQSYAREILFVAILGVAALASEVLAIS